MCFEILMFMNFYGNKKFKTCITTIYNFTTVEII